MARTLSEQAFPAAWLDAVLAAQRPYERELPFSTGLELLMLVTVGLRPAPARQAEPLPVSLPALYGKLKRTDPARLGAPVRARAERLGPVLAELGRGPPGYALRVIDGNPLPATGAARRDHRGAARPGLAMVVYDPDRGLATDRVMGEATPTSRSWPLVARAGPGQVWIGDRPFCPGARPYGWEAAGAGSIVRGHAPHPRLREAGPWHEAGEVWPTTSWC